MSTEEQTASATPLWQNQTFRRYFLGTFVTNAGDSLYTVALLWVVFDLSGSTALTGLANALLLAPYLLQIIAGPVVDRLPVGRVLIASQVLQGLVVVVLIVSAATESLTVALVFATIPALALLQVFVGPVQSTLVPRIVDDDQLTRGNAALATVTLGLDMVFDALGGFLVAAVGVTALFLLDSLTFAVSAVLFGSMVIPSVNSDTAESVSPLSSYVADLRDGIAILRGTLFVELLAIGAVFNFAVGVALAILPAVGDSLGGPAVYGLLLGALGAGRLAGSLSASVVEDLPYGRFKAAASLLSALLWVGAIAAPSLTLTALLFGLAWISAGADGVLTETLNQRVFPTSMLGRVSAIKGTTAMATLPLGSLVGGILAGYLGVGTTMTLAAGGFGFAGVAFVVRSPLRRLPPASEMRPETFGLSPDRPPAAGSSEETE